LCTHASNLGNYSKRSHCQERFKTCFAIRFSEKRFGCQITY